MKKLYLIALILVAVCASIILYRDNPSSLDDETYKFRSVKSGVIEEYFFANATMEPSVVVNIGAQVNGLITHLHVKEGDFVKKGQLLLEIDPTLQQNEVDSIESRLKSSEAAHKQTIIDLEWSRKELNKKRILKNKEIISKNEYLTYKKDYDKLQLQSLVDKENIKQISSELQSAKAKLGYTKIVSPIDGQVLGVLMQQGQTIVSSQSSPNIMLLADTRIMRANISISEHDIRKVKVGSLVQGLDNKNFEGIIDSVRSAPNSYIFNENRDVVETSNSNIVYRVFSNFDNKDYSLFTAMNVPVKVITNSNDVHAMIEKSCLKFNGSKISALKISDGKTSNVIIDTGVSNLDYIEVLSGLEPEDEVVCE